MNVIEKIEQTKIVPVVVIKDIKETTTIIESLAKGGIKVAEICYRNENASEAIKYISKHYPDFLVGAGTVINAKQCEDAIGVGAKFIVSPGFSKEVLAICEKHNAPYFPGVVTPTEIMEALNYGLTYLKFFPANAFGGIKTMKALSAAFPQIKFMPTGGIDIANLNEYVNQKFIFAIGGSWLLKGDITANCIEALDAIKESK